MNEANIVDLTFDHYFTPDKKLGLGNAEISGTLCSSFFIARGFPLDCSALTVFCWPTAMVMVV